MKKVNTKSSASSSNLPPSLASSRPYYAEMVKRRKLDPTFNEAYKPFGNYFLNKLVTIREFLQNAVTYGGTKAHILRIVLSNDATYLCVATNARGFADEAEIIDKGLTPSESGDVGRSLQGSGTVYTASYSHSSPEIIVMSRLDDGSMGCAVAFPNHDTNDWQINRCPRFAKIATECLGAKFMSKFNVFSFVRINGRDDTIKIEHLNTLTYLAPDIVDKLEATYFLNVFRPSRACPSFSDMKKSAHDARRVVSRQEFELKLADDGRGRPTPIQEIKVDVTVPGADAKHQIKATVKLTTFPGKSKKSKDSQGSHHRFMNLRATPVSFRPSVELRPWKAGEVSDCGERPLAAVYLRMPAIAKANPQERFQRFAGNAVQLCQRNTAVLEAMGIIAHEHPRSAPGIEDRPFTIIDVLVEDIQSVMLRRDGTPDYLPPQPCSAMSFAASKRRMADFTIDAMKANEIIMAVAQAAAPLVSEQTHSWYKEKFKNDCSGLCPFDSLIRRVKGTPHNRDYAIHDLIEGGTFDGKLSVGKEYFFAIRQDSTSEFFESLSLSPSRTRLGLQSNSEVSGSFAVICGAKLKKLRSQRPEIDRGLRELAQQFSIATPISVFQLKVPGAVLSRGRFLFGKIEEDGTETSVSLNDYKSAIASNETDAFFPSKRIWVGSPTGMAILLGSVREVPTGEPSGDRGTSTKPLRADEGRPIVDDVERLYFENENIFKAVHFEATGHLRFNKLHPAFSVFRAGNWAEKKLLGLAMEIKRIITGLHSAIGAAMPILSPNYRAYDELSERRSNAYVDWKDAVINEAVNSMLSDPDSDLTAAIKKLEDAKTQSTQASEALAS